MTLPRRFRTQRYDHLRADLELFSDVASIELKALGDDVRLPRRFRFGSAADLTQDLEALREQAQASLERLGDSGTLPRLFRLEQLETDLKRFRDMLQERINVLTP